MRDTRWVCLFVCIRAIGCTGVIGEVWRKSTACTSMLATIRRSNGRSIGASKASIPVPADGTKNGAAFQLRQIIVCTDFITTVWRKFSSLISVKSTKENRKKLMQSTRIYLLLSYLRCYSAIEIASCQTKGELYPIALAGNFIIQSG